MILDSKKEITWCRKRKRLRIPEGVRSLVDDLRSQLLALLRDTLIGIYMYGSLTYGDFDERRSDVDIIVLIKHKLNESQWRALKDLYACPSIRRNKWFKKLEMDYVVHSTLHEFRHVVQHGLRTTHLTHGKLRREAESDGGNPINWLNIRQCGIVIFGPAPALLVPRIGNNLLLNAVKKALEEIKTCARTRTKMNLRRQAYMVITLCRIIYTLQEGKMLSKEAAAKWGAKRLPTQLRRFAGIALEGTHNPERYMRKDLISGILKLISYAEKLFREI